MTAKNGATQYSRELSASISINHRHCSDTV